ncbi:sigma-E factor negative regulatory protein RseB [Gammaproteobacteria bacterium]
MFFHRWGVTAYLTGFLLTCVLWVATVAVATEVEDGAVRTQLGRMLEAMRSRNYVSRVVHAQGNQLRSFEVWHQSDHEWEREQWMVLDGPPRVLLRQDHSSLFTMSEKGPIPIEAVQYQQQMFGGQPADIDSIAQYYHFAALGESRVAGRAAQVIGLIPRDPWRYGRRYFLDLESALPLKTDITDAQGLPVEQFLLISISLDPPPATFPAWPLDIKPPLEEKDPPAGTAEPIWTFTQLPPGFRLQRQTWFSRSGNQVTHSILGDGLASISVYVEPAGNEGASPVDLALGGTHTLSQRVGAFDVTALGEVPAVTLRAILDTLRPEAPAHD